MESKSGNCSLQPYFLDDLIIETLQNYQLRLDDSKCEVSVDISEKMEKVFIDSFYAVFLYSYPFI